MAGDILGTAGGVKKRFRDQGDTTYAESVSVGSLSVGALVKGIVCEVITCTIANSDFSVGAAMPAGTKYIAVYADNDCVIAMGEATSPTKGIGLGAGLTIFPVTVTGTAPDDMLHAQCATAGAKVRVSYLGS